MTNETNRTPSPASTAGGARQSIADDPEFCELLKEYSDWGIGEDLAALIAHIDTWAARSAGDAVPADDFALKASLRAVCLNARAVIKRWESPLWRQEVGTNEFINQLRRAVDAAELSALPGIAPAPGNTVQPTQTQKGDTNE